MDEKSITILTGSGNGLGTGHLQRMLNLASYVNRTSSIKALILDRNINSHIPDSDHIIRVKKIPDNTSLIIRDMRDSQNDEIELLKKTAPVLVIDDAGTGRYSSDYRVDLLPGLYDGNDPRPEFFLYGYNFTESINRMNNDFIEKKTDFIINSSSHNNYNCTMRIYKSLPDNFKSIIVGKNSEQQSQSYAGDLISSKVVLTHFGILLYEAYISGCSIITLDPTDYHSMLSKKASKTMQIKNLGNINNINYKTATDTIINCITENENKSVSITSIREVINNKLQNFLGFIMEIIGKSFP